LIARGELAAQILHKARKSVVLQDFGFDTLFKRQLF